MTTPQSIREAFEAWISEPPFEKSVSRLNASSAWPGSYRDIETDLAWQAWQAALAQQAVDVDAIRADAALILSELDAVTAYTDDASDHIGCAEIAATRIIAAVSA